MRTVMLLLVAALSTNLAAQGYPSKPIRYVVPFPPGGATDTLARVIGAKLSDAWGVPVVVENRPGAGGNVGTDLVAKSAPDGHTLLMAVNSHAINASLYSKLPYDPIKDFVPVILVATTPNVLVVNPSVPANSVQELIALAKARPGTLTFASAGAGSGAQLAGELFKALAKVDLTHVPYKGAAPAMTDLVGGQVSMSFIVYPVASPQIQAGKLRTLAVTSLGRSSLVPNVPAISEAGLTGFDVVSWFGTLVPAGTPPAVVSRLNAEIGRSLQAPDVKEKMNAQGLELRGGTPAQLDAFIKADWDVWDKLIKSLGIRLD